MQDFEGVEGVGGAGRAVGGFFLDAMMLAGGPAARAVPRTAAGAALVDGARVGGRGGVVGWLGADVGVGLLELGGVFIDVCFVAVGARALRDGFHEEAFRGVAAGVVTWAFGGGAGCPYARSFAGFGRRGVKGLRS